MIERILLILFLVMLAGPLKGEVTENLTYKYYRVEADSSRSLLSILNAASPIRNNGNHFHGHTRWDVEWYFHWTEMPNGRCKIKSVSVDLTATIQMPRLVGGASKQRDQFGAYVAALRTHELGHYEIGIQTAETIDRKILTLPEMASCKELGVAGNEIGDKQIMRAEDKRKKYDELTGHGKTQGAWLDR